MNTKVSLAYVEKVFDIEVAELTKAQKTSLGEKIKVEQKKVYEYQAIKTEFKDLIATYDTNKALLENDDTIPIVEKVKMLWEQKKLLGEIKTMRPEVEKKANEPLHYEEIAKEHFEMMISGDGKIALVKELDDAKESYEKIINIIMETVQKEKEKKSSSS